MKGHCFVTNMILYDQIKHKISKRARALVSPIRITRILKQKYISTYIVLALTYYKFSSNSVFICMLHRSDRYADQNGVFVAYLETFLIFLCRIKYKLILSKVLSVHRNHFGVSIKKSVFFGIFVYL
jgi:hypothetical protein